jgi:hypothetical protein
MKARLRERRSSFARTAEIEPLEDSHSQAAMPAFNLQEGGSPMASNIEANKKGYESFQRGDIPSLLKDLIDDDCTWISPGPKDKLPWAGTFKGKQEIAHFFALVEHNLEFSEFTPREMIEQGDTVVVLGTLAGRAKKTGKPVKNEWAHVFKFSQEKAVSFQEYIDTAAPTLVTQCLNRSGRIPFRRAADVRELMRRGFGTPGPHDRQRRRGTGAARQR